MFHSSEKIKVGIGFLPSCRLRYNRHLTDIMPRQKQRALKSRDEQFRSGVAVGGRYPLRFVAKLANGALAKTGRGEAGSVENYESGKTTKAERKAEFRYGKCKKSQFFQS
ncbi:hypothetical protein RvY_02107-2 [Ramazzottius varieornatus]|uniref:Uncharacterized protein n=1 Tax=Ramazzottius varieornatus TaxID=947166 RepID=A0A1D1UJF6_RAMVA|nr:hypothetical protein RvY_02107-2 [Ramazzottius varieornatus]